MRKLMAALVSLAMLLAVTAATTPSAVAFEGVVNDTGVRVRAAPSLSAPIVKMLSLGQEVDVVRTSGDWYQLPSGGWVHSSLISRAGASSGGRFSGRWVDVDLSSQTARAMQGNRVVYTAPVTTGMPGWETPTGTFRIFSRPGTVNMRGPGYYQPNVQYTQYFTAAGDALHANYWRPASVFGNTPTSHGCVGMRTGDAAFFWNFASIGTPVVVHY